MTPLQQVKQRFGSKSQLVESLLPLLETKEAAVKSALMGTTNAKLLRIHASATEVRERFGSRKGLIERITATRYPQGKADDGFERKVQEATLKQLLELHRQVGAK